MSSGNRLLNSTQLFPCSTHKYRLLRIVNSSILTLALEDVVPPYLSVIAIEFDIELYEIRSNILLLFIQLLLTIS